MILKTRAKPVSVSANGDYEAERGQCYKRREKGGEWGWRGSKIRAFDRAVDTEINK